MSKTASRTAIVLVLATVTIAASSGCQSCRNFFRRGAPCGTRAMAPRMMGAPRALGSPLLLQPQPNQVVYPQMVMPQQSGCCCPQPVIQSPCCDPCPCNRVPCGPGYSGGGDCGCIGGEVVGQGGWSAGYLGEGETVETFVPQGSSMKGNGSEDPGPNDKGT